jgi:(E)-4-hydroxy-3-methylbut-2-enyl-diphosphate synthase
MLGSDYPIRIQSMTDTDTKDTDATVDQIIRLIKAGADFVRVTVKGVSDAENLRNIKKELVSRGYENPLVADIHFNPHLAEIAARYVSKVRINPGNFTTSGPYSSIIFILTRNTKPSSKESKNNLSRSCRS